jgi:hypothetical protein
VAGEITIRQPQVAVNSEIAGIAVSLATRAVREALAALKAAGARAKSGDLSLEDLLAAVKRTRTSVQEDSTSGGEIASIEQLGAALGIGDESETSWNGSRKWRDPGRLALGR